MPPPNSPSITPTKTIATVDGEYFWKNQVGQRLVVHAPLPVGVIVADCRLGVVVLAKTATQATAEVTTELTKAIEK